VEPFIWMIEGAGMGGALDTSDLWSLI
jgi:hypothetical protein